MDQSNKITFGTALAYLKEGKKMTRTGWNGKGLFVQAQFPDEHSKMTNPYLYINAQSVGGKLNPWLPSQTDLFAEDWEIV